MAAAWLGRTDADAVVRNRQAALVTLDHKMHQGLRGIGVASDVGHGFPEGG